MTDSESDTGLYEGDDLEDSASTPDDPESTFHDELRKKVGISVKASELTTKQITHIMQLEKRFGQSVLFFVESRNASGVVDPKAERILFDREGRQQSALYTGIRRCRDCKKMYKGGGTFAKHSRDNKCVKPAGQKQGSILAHIQQWQGTSQLSQPSQHERLQMRKAVAHWVSRESRPFSIVEDKGLLNVIQIALDIGHNWHSAPQKLQSSGGAFSVDYGKRYKDYMTVVVHFIHDWEFKSVNIGMLRSEREDKGHQNVWFDILEVFNRYGMNEDDVKKLFVVSDQGSNITKAIRVFHQKGVLCFCHLMNTVSNRTFTPYKAKKSLLFENDLTPEENEHVELARTLLDACKKLANGIHDTVIADQYGISVVREGETRWLTKLATVESIKGHGAEMFELKNDPNAEKKLSKKVFGALKVIVEQLGST